MTTKYVNSAYKVLKSEGVRHKQVGIACEQCVKKGIPPEYTTLEVTDPWDSWPEYRCYFCGHDCEVNQ